MKFVKMFLALVGLAALFVFVRDNTGKIVVKFWDYATPEIEIFLVLIITFALGMIVASFGSTLKIVKLKRQLRNAGAGTPAPKKEGKKDKKSKNKKHDTDKDESHASGSPAGHYTPPGTAAAGSVSTAASTAETAPAEIDTSPAQPENDDEQTIGSTVVEEGNISDAELSDAEEEHDAGKQNTEEVIPLPADETPNKEEDRK